jgi:tripartite-type tricarboxylate transporter receptor subunit TctC
MMRRRTLLGLTPALLAQAPADWPTRSIRWVVPFTAGGNTDVLARLYGAQLGKTLGQPIIIENRTGAAGAIGTEAVVRSPADGYTLVVGSPGSIVNGPLLAAQRRYDPMVDLVAVANLGVVPLVIAVRSSLPARDLAGLVALSRTTPGGITIGTSGIGGAHHLPLELFKKQTEANLVHVPYRGGGSAVPDVVAGNVDGALVEFSSTLDLHKEGRLRILGLAAATRSTRAPEVATFIEQGLPGFLAAAFVGLLAPAGTPAPILARYQDGVRAALTEPEVQARLASLGVDPPGPAELTTAGFGAYIAEEIAKAKRAIEIAGLKPE